DWTIKQFRVYFIHTREGIAVAYPRIHGRNPEIKVGAYVQVTVSPPSNEVSFMEVEDIMMDRQPPDHVVSVIDSSIQISCEAVFLELINGIDFFFENKYLGRLLRRNWRTGGMKKGTVYRVVCRRTTSGERI
ncbi:hypothetical protein PENTCL1PPCAC_1146, partial [Pristionchus entomophagus]